MSMENYESILEKYVMRAKGYLVYEIFIIEIKFSSWIFQHSCIWKQVEDWAFFL